MLRISEMHQHRSLADGFNIDQMTNSNERFFLEMLMKIDVKPDTKGGIHLTDLDIHNKVICLCG